LWLPVDPTLNQFPADPTHVRLARGGLDKQAVVLTLIGRARMTVLEVQVTPGTERVLVGQAPGAPRANAAPIDLALPPRPASCWSWVSRLWRRD
jgi:hypothetical protein